MFENLMKSDTSSQSKLIGFTNTVTVMNSWVLTWSMINEFANFVSRLMHNFEGENVTHIKEDSMDK